MRPIMDRRSAMAETSIGDVLSIQAECQRLKLRISELELEARTYAASLSELERQIADLVGDGGMEAVWRVFRDKSQFAENNKALGLQLASAQSGYDALKRQMRKALRLLSREKARCRIWRQRATQEGHVFGEIERLWGAGAVRHPVDHLRKLHAATLKITPLSGEEHATAANPANLESERRRSEELARKALELSDRYKAQYEAADARCGELEAMLERALQNPEIVELRRENLQLRQFIENRLFARHASGRAAQ